MSDYLSVSSLTKYLKMKFDRDPYLERVYLTGQVSNFRQRPSHQYFSLKDDKAVIQATMWAGVYRQLGFTLEEGMQVNVVGRIQLYEPGGSYSIIIEKAEPDGVGALALQFEQLKKKLSAAGYFDNRHKQPLPRFVQKIGIITSPSGAVIRDIITTISRRFAGVELLLFPTKVQGKGAAEEIVANIALANQMKDLDLLIVGRGGGSIEDLWAFNEEIVVEAIFASRLPVISSVGHETDVTLADFVADQRAATPTAAAELATPVTKADVLAGLLDWEKRLYQASQRQLQALSKRLERWQQSVVFRQPERLYDGYLQRVAYLSTRLTDRMDKRVRTQQQRVQTHQQGLLSLGLPVKIQSYQDKIGQLERLLLSHMANQYDRQVSRFHKAQDALLALDTQKIVERGYALVQKNQAILDSVAGIKPGDNLELSMRDGYLEVEVKDVKAKNI
ncbi:exodeoxyribonuclease VII large subunit [Streptococcus cuniculipharyngis]|uniref:Exodeoxyribonuclease 7 large subunit n=1 Tax=Streptococcus cuniculipharyngis TaxID=1562651 RepID=A0A5C5SD38_9STRE|nr:exodeoxyribonuclease VII large subunit [Streptococcus cuniculipharyngis]TWS98684.1 exodeoxyribonuclease VII large subunit [Streptococcus cuniculipharyngis]